MQCILHTDSDLKTRNTDVKLSQHEHVQAEEGTVWWRNSHPDHLPAVSPFHSGQITKNKRPTRLVPTPVIYSECTDTETQTLVSKPVQLY